MIRNIICTGLVGLLLVGCLAGCGQNSDSAPQAGQLNAGDTAELPQVRWEDLEALLGMSDEQAANALGGGEENWTADHSLLIGRIYHVNLLGTDTKVFTSYHEEDGVNSVSVWVADGEREVPESEVDAWVQTLTEYVGSQPQYDGTSSEVGSKNWHWQKGEVFLTLYWLGDTVSIGIQPVAGELH